jgi:hypothetical protein
MGAPSWHDLLLQKPRHARQTRPAGARAARACHAGRVCCPPQRACCTRAPHAALGAARTTRLHSTDASNADGNACTRRLEGALDTAGRRFETRQRQAVRFKLSGRHKCASRAARRSCACSMPSLVVKGLPTTSD